MATYEMKENRTFRIDDEGERTMLCNFVAKITKETRIMDGINTETILTIEGQASSNGKGSATILLPAVDVPANNWQGLGWVMQAWGVRAIIQPGHSIKDDLRTAIQMNSDPKKEEIYKSIGWMQIANKKHFLHAGGALTAEGNNPNIRVVLPPELGKYNLAVSG